MTTLTVRQTFALVVLFVVTSLTVIQLDNRRALDPLRTGLQDVVVPVTRVFTRLAPGGDGVDPETAERLAAVSAERDALLAENAQLRAQAREIDQLRAQLGVQQAHPDWELLSARVINPDPANFQKFFVIDRGRADGIEVGMAVVASTQTGEGEAVLTHYLGQITRVEEHAARATLLIDVTQQVAARLDGGALGIVYGRWQDGERLEMRYVETDAVPAPNELVLTSDAEVATARVPGGLIIGRVGGEPVIDRQGATQTIPVLPLVAFEELTVVTVVLGDAA